jgi:hypothetical protein
MTEIRCEAVEGDPYICTYGWAYRALFNTSYPKFSMAYAQKAIQVACRTRPRELPGLGLVRLDTFIVSKKDGFPSVGYWHAAQHDREEWGRPGGLIDPASGAALNREFRLGPAKRWRRLVTFLFSQRELIIHQ